MAQKLIIMQGVPGSGKSTRAKELKEELGDNAVICSTDDYFMVNGEYCFRPIGLSDYHSLNLERAKDLMNEGKTVIVDNTNIEAWECRRYVLHAFTLGIEILFVRVEGDYQSVHNVPQHIVENMKAKMEVLSLQTVLG